MRTNPTLSETTTDATPLWQRLLLAPAFIPICLLAGLGLRWVIAVGLPVEQISDSAWYASRASEIAAGLGYQEGGVPTAYWPVGWPAILAAGIALTGSVPVAVTTLNLIASCAIMWIILWFGRNVLNDESVGRLALLAYAVYPNHIAYAGTAATELVYTATAMAAFAVLIHGRRSPWLTIASGLLFGAATLVKPQTYLFPIGAIVMLVIVYRDDYSWRRAVGTGVLVYASLFAVVLPWSLRNLDTFGEFVLVSTNGGTALVLGANDYLTGDDFPYQDTPAFARLGVPWEEHVARQVELDRKLKAQAIDWIRDNPIRYLAWMPKKIFLLWHKDTDGFWAFDASYPRAHGIVRAAQALNQVYYLTALVLALAAAMTVTRMLLSRGNGGGITLMLLFCMPAFASLLAAVFTGQIRYHFPAMPYLLLAACWTLFRLVRARAGSVQR